MELHKEPGRKRKPVQIQEIRQKPPLNKTIMLERRRCPPARTPARYTIPTSKPLWTSSSGIPSSSCSSRLPTMCSTLHGGGEKRERKHSKQQSETKRKTFKEPSTVFKSWGGDGFFLFAQAFPCKFHFFWSLVV